LLLSAMTTISSFLTIPPVVAGPAAPDPPSCPDVVRSPMVAGYPLPSAAGDASGLIASPRYRGWAWMVRQHTRPYLYAVHFPGADAPHELRAIRVLGATNLDWEDVVYQDGKLYLMESDQAWVREGHGERTRVIYEVPEPDPLGPSSVRLSAVYRYAYPGGRRYNTEAAFSFAGHLVFVPKTTPAQLYRFDQPLSPQRVNPLRFVASLAGSNTVSLAAVSPDQKTLVLANHEVLFAYQLPNPAQYLWQFATGPVQRRRIDVGDNVEAGGFFLTGQCKLVLAAKSTTVYRILLSRPPTTTRGPDHAGPTPAAS
jgi:hypothetical protein